MIISGQSLRGLFTAYDTRFSKAYAGLGNIPWYTNVATEMPSRTATNVYAWLARLPALREWLGPRIVQNLATRSYSLDNKKFELTLGIKREVIEDDQYDTYGPWMDQAAYAARKWPDRTLYPIIQGGDGSTYGLAFDGQTFFNASHPINPNDSSVGTQSNVFTTKPLNFDNYAFVRTAMMALKGDDNFPLGIVPRLLLVPPQLEAAAKIICENRTIAVTTMGGMTVVGGQDNPYYGTAKVLVVPEFANQGTSWYLIDDSQPVKPFIWQLRQAPEFAFRNQITDEHVFAQDEFLYGVRARGAGGYGLWFLAAKATA